jgi:DNA mismatch repair protein MutS2
MKINVHVTNLKLVDEQTAETKKSGAGRIGVSKSMNISTQVEISKVLNISTQVDIRGANVDEAVEILGKFLDDAAIAGLSEVTVIHGKGTGMLRNGVHQYLKSNSHVKSYRLGKYGEGENGVTVVSMR